MDCQALLDRVILPSICRKRILNEVVSMCLEKDCLIFRRVSESLMVVLIVVH